MTHHAISRELGEFKMLFEDLSVVLKEISQLNFFNLKLKYDNLLKTNCLPKVFGFIKNQDSRFSLSKSGRKHFREINRTFSFHNFKISGLLQCLSSGESLPNTFFGAFWA